MNSTRATCARCTKHCSAQLQRGKGLEGFAYLDGHYLLSLDGTGYFSSSTIHCPQCGEKHHRNGTITYYHQMLGAVLVHPDRSEVFPLAPEPILKRDGARKNDCERDAAKRLLTDLRREHPHLKLIVIEDGLASNAPHIRQPATPRNRRGPVLAPHFACTVERMGAPPTARALCRGHQ